MTSLTLAVGSALEATRPRTSGQSVNVHVVRAEPGLAPDYEKMRTEIAGELAVEVGSSGRERAAG